MSRIWPIDGFAASRPKNGFLPVRSNSCWAPPAAEAFGRAGLANRRSLAAAVACSALAGAARSASLGFGARRAGRSVEEAGSAGPASPGGRPSSFSISSRRGGVAPGPGGALLAQLAGVGRLGLGGEPALGEAGQGGDEVGRQPADHLRP